MGVPKLFSQSSSFVEQIVVEHGRRIDAGFLRIRAFDLISDDFL